MSDEAKGQQRFTVVSADGQREVSAAEFASLGFNPPPITESTKYRPSPLEIAVADEHAKSQRFFAALAADIRRPSYGVLQADFVRSLLLRAQEAGLFTPEAS